ncbi:MAG: hypothetical protein Q9190_000934 [Brigantiaea leucoxantha]
MSQTPPDWKRSTSPCGTEVSRQAQQGNPRSEPSPDMDLEDGDNSYSNAYEHSSSPTDPLTHAGGWITTQLNPIVAVNQPTALLDTESDIAPMPGLETGLPERKAAASMAHETRYETRLKMKYFGLWKGRLEESKRAKRLHSTMKKYEGASGNC